MDEEIYKSLIFSFFFNIRLKLKEKKKIITKIRIFHLIWG